MNPATQSEPRRHGLVFLIYFVVGSLLGSSAAQSLSPGQRSNPYAWRTSFSPSTAVVVAAVLGTFFLMAFFSIYVRTRRARAELERYLATARAAGPRGGPTGLPPVMVNALPAFVYAEVKGHKLWKGAVECAVCLGEFADEDELRLLPKCGHIFHSGCIDAWLAAHKTCPVCRADVEAAVADVVITVEGEEEKPATAATTATTTTTTASIVITVEREEETTTTAVMTGAMTTAAGTMATCDGDQQRR